MPHDLQADPAIAEIVRRLVRAVDPDRLVLFGSRARGMPSAASDYDILIVKPSAETRYRRLRPARSALWGIGVPVDLLWYTPDELKDRAEVPVHVATQAVLNGVELYAKDPAC